MFITFEGIDGSGKTTQSKMFFEYLKNINRKVYLTKEPNGTTLGSKIRKIFLNSKQKYSNITSTLLLCSARSDHIEQIILPKLLKQYIVICDRFVDSTAAYQTVNLNDLNINSDTKLSQNNKLEAIKKIYLLHDALFSIMPNITFFLDINLSNIEQNLNIRSNNTELNKLDILPIIKKQEIINNYHIIKNLYPNRIININGNDTIENVHKNIVNIWNKIFKNYLI
ncbi:MAG: dTMP kinase [Rickettsiales bacterium]